MKEFEKYGVFATIDSLAGGDVLKYESILGIDFYTIMTKLQKNKDESKYQRKLSEILRNKGKTK